MDASLYKTLTTSRGIKYSYYFSPAKGKATLLFCHGFPSTSRDWQHQAMFFKEQDYGVIVPDQLGYGGTDKPTDPSMYNYSLVSQDLIDILDAEKVDRAIAIGHDFGSLIVSRLANYFPERFIAYAFVAAPYIAPATSIDMKSLLATVKERFGYELYGYQLFFSEDGADLICQEHIDTFFGLIYPEDPAIWKTHVAPTGALKAALLADEKPPPAAYLTDEDKKVMRETFLRNGLAAPVCYYKQSILGLEAKDNKQIPASRMFPPASCPLFYGAALNDYICLPAVGKAVFNGEAFHEHKVTTKDYDADHWVMLAKPDELNRDLNEWITGLGIIVDS